MNIFTRSPVIDDNPCDASSSAFKYMQTRWPAWSVGWIHWLKNPLKMKNLTWSAILCICVFFLLIWSLSRNNWGVCSAGNFAKKIVAIFTYAYMYFYPKSVKNTFFIWNLIVDGVGYQKSHSRYSKYMCWHDKTEKCITTEFSNDPE